MSEKSPNLDLMLYTNSDSAKKFGSWLEEMAGAGAGSNLMKIDSAFSEVREGLSQKADLQNGKVPVSQLPPLSSNDFTTAEKNKLANLGKALNFSGAVSGVYNGTKDLSVTIPKPARTCTFVVGTSTAGWTEADCDYLCDGVDDQIEINAALSALSPGGEVKLLNGVYLISDEINLSSGRRNLTGCGVGTVLRRTGTNSFLIRAGEYCELSHLQIIGTKGMQGQAGQAEILIPTTAFFTSVHNLRIENAAGEGIRNLGENTSLYDCSFSCCVKGIRTKRPGRIFGNYFEYCDNVGIEIYENSYDGGSVIGNIIYGGINGILLNKRPTTTSIVHGETIVGNVIQYANTGIQVSYGKYTVVSGNVCSDCIYTGIIVTSSERCLVIGNMVEMGEGTPSDYNDGEEFIDSLYISDCKDCVFSNNHISGKDYTVIGGEGNEFYQNKCTRTEEATA